VYRASPEYRVFKVTPDRAFRETLDRLVLKATLGP
jgi:hypothetical protein